MGRVQSFGFSYLLVTGDGKAVIDDVEHPLGGPLVALRVVHHTLTRTRLSANYLGRAHARALTKPFDEGGARTEPFLSGEGPARESISEVSGTGAPYS